MTDLYQAIEVSPAEINKIRKHLDKINAAKNDSGELSSAIAAATEEFNKFFLNYGRPQFAAHKLHTNENPESRIYNENNLSLNEDIETLYQSLASALNSTVASYNYATVVSNEIREAANLASSKVLDLNILNNFTKGAVIVAGDDFIDSSKIDTSVGVETTQAEFMHGASSVGLKRVDTIIVTGPNTTISVTPVMPLSKTNKVNTAPTPGNLERIYEGSYYNYLGEQRPEGGELELKYFTDPSSIPGEAKTSFKNGHVVSETDVNHAEAIEATKGIGFFATIESSEEKKQAIRKLMLDGNPNTFWEIEYVYETEPLIDPYGSISEDAVVDAIAQSDAEV